MSFIIRSVIYQTVGVNYWSAEKIKMFKTDPKKEMTQAFMKKKLLLHKAFKKPLSKVR